MKTGKTAFCALAVAMVMLSGCAPNPPMRVALTEMGATSKSEYGAYGLRMVRSVNVTGMGAEEVVGSLTTDADNWSFGEQVGRIFSPRSDLPDTMSPRLITGQSMIVERRFDSEASIGDLVELRDQLQNYQIRIADAARLQIKQAVLQSTLLSSGDKTPPQSLTSETVKALSSLYPGESYTTHDEIRDALTAINKELQANTLTKQLDSIKGILKKPGIIITNWQADASASGAADTAVGSAGASKKSAASGLLILGSPRIITLYLGDDLLKRIKEAETSHPHSDALFNTGRNYLTHYQLRAKQIVFAESRQAEIRANLDVQLDKAASLMVGVNGAALLQQLKAQIAASYAAITAASESGVLVPSVGNVSIQRNFSLKRSEIREHLIQEIKTASDSMPVISVRVALDDHLKKRAAASGK